MEQRVEAVNPPFEIAMNRLEEIVHKLEGGNLTLDAALELFQEGVQLAKYCNNKLAEAENKIQILLEDRDGSLNLKDFGGQADEF